MNVNPPLHSWYASIITSNLSEVHCDHLAVCLLLELIPNVTQDQRFITPILTSINALATVVKAPDIEVKHSLELLQELSFIQINYPHEPELLLAGLIQIALNRSRISQLSETTAKNERSGYLYIVRSGLSNQYKIGRTNNFQKRLKTLQTSCAVQLTVVKTFFSLDVVSLEKTAHDKFAHFRQKGEWFELNSSQLTQLLSWLERCH